MNPYVAGPRNKTDRWHKKGLLRVWQLSTRWNCRRQLVCFEPRETAERLQRDCRETAGFSGVARILLRVAAEN